MARNGTTKRAKARVAGTCTKCSQPYNAGDQIYWTVPVHETCQTGGGFTAIPPAPTLDYTRLKALESLEEAIKVGAHMNGVTDAIEKGWERYEKLKLAGLRPGSSTEERTALRHALIDAVKLAF